MFDYKNMLQGLYQNRPLNIEGLEDDDINTDKIEKFKKKTLDNFLSARKDLIHVEDNLYFSTKGIVVRLTQDKDDGYFVKQELVEPVKYGSKMDPIFKIDGQLVSFRKKLMELTNQVPEYRQVVCLRDGDVENNALDNLYWGNHTANDAEQRCMRMIQEILEIPDTVIRNNTGLNLDHYLHKYSLEERILRKRIGKFRGPQNNRLRRLYYALARYSKTRIERTNKEGYVEVFPDHITAAKSVSGDPQRIRDCINGALLQYKGYKWKRVK